MGDDDESTNTVNWNSQLEKILSDEGERALCYSWLHNKSQQRYANLDTYIALPVIVLSTLAGTASIGSSSLFGDSKIANIAIGGISLSVGILNTISNYFGWAKRSEGHKIASVTYSKIHRFILVELSMPRDERMAAGDMLKIVREQIDRLQETSPQIHPKIIDMFNKHFADNTPDVSKPEITNGLDPIIVYVDHEISSPKPVLPAPPPAPKKRIDIKVVDPPKS
jgi:hypothetical protein